MPPAWEEPRVRGERGSHSAPPVPAGRGTPGIAPPCVGPLEPAGTHKGPSVRGGRGDKSGSVLLVPTMAGKGQIQPSAS